MSLTRIIPDVFGLQDFAKCYQLKKESTGPIPAMNRDVKRDRPIKNKDLPIVSVDYNQQELLEEDIFIRYHLFYVESFNSLMEDLVDKNERYFDIFKI